jgi:hypothetical protein
MNSVQREVLYNAVWRLMGHIGEIQQYGVTFDQYKSEYDTLFPNVWRIAQRVARSSSRVPGEWSPTRQVRSDRRTLFEKVSRGKG